MSEPTRAEQRRFPDIQQQLEAEGWWVRANTSALWIGNADARMQVPFVQVDGKPVLLGTHVDAALEMVKNNGRDHLANVLKTFMGGAEAPSALKKYRWLTVGDFYTYVAKQGKGDDARRGEQCKVVTVPHGGRGPGNARVVFADGHVAIVPAGVLRKVDTE